MIMSLNIKENHSNLTLQYSFHCPIYIVAEPDPTVFGRSRIRPFLAGAGDKILAPALSTNPVAAPDSAMAVAPALF